METAARLAGAEFVTVDVETNGRSGEACEMTEVAAVLVGGGELHESYSSLVRVLQPLSRGIQRFTGIRQAMVDEAPTPERVLPAVGAMLDGRVLVAHSASFDRRVLRQAFERCGLAWPEPPVLCTVALARRFAPLVRRRGLAPLAEALGIEVEGTHRALVDARTCARVFCALFPKLCAHAATVGEAAALIGPRRARGARGGRGRGRAEPEPRPFGGRPETVERRPSPSERPDLSALPGDPGVYVFRDERGRPLYVGKSVSIRTRARAHFSAPAGWTERAALVDYRPTNSELGALVLENRLIKAWQPPGNVKLKRTDRWVYIRCRLDIAYPVLEVAAEPASGHAVSIGPVRGRPAAAELVDQLNSMFTLRHCGRALPRREHPSAYGQMGRCLSPCLGDLDPNLYRSRLDAALALFESRDAAPERLLRHIEAQMREAAAAERFERAAVLRGRHERLSGILERLGGVLEATHSRSRLALAPHPAKPRWDAFWIVGGRVVDWGPLPPLAEVGDRTSAALAGRPGPRRRPALPAAEVDEVRIAAAWLAANEAPQLPLDEQPSGDELLDWVEASTAPPSAPRLSRGARRRGS